MTANEVAAILAVMAPACAGLGAWGVKIWGSYTERRDAARQARLDDLEARRLSQEVERAQLEEERRERADLIESYKSELMRLTARVESLESQVLELRSELHSERRENERLRSDNDRLRADLKIGRAHV